MPKIRVVATGHLRTKNGKAAPPFFTVVEALRLARMMMRERVKICPHHRNPPDDGIGGMCAHVIACNYGYLNCGFDDAISMWRGIPDKYRRHGIEKMRQAPAGALLFWKGGSQEHGHVAMSAGNGRIYSTDLPDFGFMGKVPVDEVVNSFGQEPKGWTFPFFELAIRDQTRKELRDLDRIIALQQDSIASDKKAIKAITKEQDRDRVRRMVRDSRDQIETAMTVTSTFVG